MSDAKTLAEAIRTAVGAKPGDVIRVSTPQFEREPGYPAPGWMPQTREDFESIREMPGALLREIGLRPWGEEPEGAPDARMLWLFPGEWYARIPKGFGVVNIFGRREAFVPGRTDNDIRFGCLSYGIFERGRS